MRISEIRLDINLIQWILIPQTEKGNYPGMLSDVKYIQVKFLCFIYYHKLRKNKIKIDIN